MFLFLFFLGGWTDSLAGPEATQEPMQHEALLNHISERGETKGLEIGIGSL